MERRQLLRDSPSPAALQEIALHESYIDDAADSLTPLTHALVQSFRALIGYDRTFEGPATATFEGPAIATFVGPATVSPVTPTCPAYTPEELLIASPEEIRLN